MDEPFDEDPDPIDPEMRAPTTGEMKALLPGVDTRVLSALPGVARIAIGAWARTATWGASSAYHAGSRLTNAAISGESATEFIEDVRDEFVRNTRRALGLDDGTAAAPSRQTPRRTPNPDRALESLRERGNALLERSADVTTAEMSFHPGFDRIVDQLSPDEARILRLLHTEGPQGIIYVNRQGPFGFGAREVARRLSLIGREAGCVHPALVPGYLDNLVRLGLVAIRRDPVGDEALYQVIEAQPEVIEAMKEASSEGGFIFRGASSRRGIHLTDYGQSFCDVCLSGEPD